MGAIRTFVQKATLRDIPDVRTIVTEDLPNAERAAERYFKGILGGTVLNSVAGVEYVLLNDHTVSHDLAVSRGAAGVFLMSIVTGLAALNRAVKVGTDIAHEMQYRHDLAAFGEQQVLDIDVPSQARSSLPALNQVYDAAKDAALANEASGRGYSAGIG